MDASEKINRILQLVSGTPYSFGQDLEGQWYLHEPLGGNTYVKTEDDLDFWLKFFEDYEVFKNGKLISEDGVVHMSLYPDPDWYRKSH